MARRLGYRRSGYYLPGPDYYDADWSYTKFNTYYEPSGGRYGKALRYGTAAFGLYSAFNSAYRVGVNARRQRDYYRNTGYRPRYPR